MEYVMVDGLTILAFLCIIGCGSPSWQLGHRAGIEHALDFLEDAGVIEFTEGESSL